MGNKISSLLYVKGGEKTELSLITAKEIIERTGFSYGQVEQFWTRFLALDSRGIQKLNRDDLENISELNDNPLKDRIIEAMLQYTSDGEINFSTFVKIIAIFRTVSDSSSKEKKEKRRTEKLRFAFKIYDIDNDSKINLDDLSKILRKMIGDTIAGEKILQIANRMISETHSKDIRDGIDFEDYCKCFANDDINLKMSIPFLKRQK